MFNVLTLSIRENNKWLRTIDHVRDFLGFNGPAVMFQSVCKSSAYVLNAQSSIETKIFRMHVYQPIKIIHTNTLTKYKVDIYTYCMYYRAHFTLYIYRYRYNHTKMVRGM